MEKDFKNGIDIENLVKNILEGNWKELLIPKKGDSECELEKAVRFFGIEQTQLRNFFEKTQKAKEPEDLLELIPQVKYSAGRKLVSYQFVEFIEKSVIAIVNERENEKLNNFKQGMKYLVAFIKFVENKNLKRGEKNAKA
ncbi:MAG TPA: hypothetical protein EYH56_01095 [Nanoarchaeota archaeon]|nr:hypothetical protein [Nanoarchaeota archaeon]